MRDISKYAEDYIERNSFEQYQVRYRRKNTLATLRFIADKSILEIGCGMRPLFLDMNDFAYYVVVEPGKVFFDNAVKNSNDDKRIICVNGFLEEKVQELQEYEYDYIVCDGLLHEVQDPAKMLQSIHALCKKDTVVHISVPNANSFHRILAKESNLISDVYQESANNILFQQNTIFDLQKLMDLIFSIDEGTVINQGSYFIKPFTHEQMERCLENKIFGEDVLDGFYNMEKYMPGLGSEIFVDYKWNM